MVQSLFICYRCARSWAEQIAFAQRETAIDALMCGHLCVYVCALTLTSSLEMGEVVRFFFFFTPERNTKISVWVLFIDDSFVYFLPDSGSGRLMKFSWKPCSFRSTSRWKSLLFLWVAPPLSGVVMYMARRAALALLYQ